MARRLPHPVQGSRGRIRFPAWLPREFRLAKPRSRRLRPCCSLITVHAGTAMSLPFANWGWRTPPVTDPSRTRSLERSRRARLPARRLRLLVARVLLPGFALDTELSSSKTAGIHPQHPGPCPYLQTRERGRPVMAGDGEEALHAQGDDRGGQQASALDGRLGPRRWRSSSSVSASSRGIGGAGHGQVA